MLRALPGWIVDDATSVREEVEQWKQLTPAERWRLALLCCQDVIWAVRANEEPRRILDAVDPLPASTVVALERLRRKAGWGSDAP